MSKDVVNISNSVSSKDGFIAINEEFKKQKLLLEDLQKEINKKVESIKNKGLSSEDFTKELKELLLSLKNLNLDNVLLELKLTNKFNRYKKLTYDIAGNLIEMNIFNSPSMSTLYFNIIYEYTGDDLTIITTKRKSDGFTYTKELTYDINSNLVNININII